MHFGKLLLNTLLKLVLSKALLTVKKVESGVGEWGVEGARINVVGIICPPGFETGLSFWPKSGPSPSSRL